MGIDWVSMYEATGFSAHQMVGSKIHLYGWDYNEDTKALREKLINTSPTRSLEKFKSWL